MSPKTKNAEPPEVQQSLTEAIGIWGWAHLDSILLAALVTELPLLFKGTHGTAKTMAVERIAANLDVALRHYNAAILNYDDLIGIPMPDEKAEGLKFIASANAIWGAEFVFFDEISRCRPDLQNKLFPIIYERVVVGERLSKLKYRWAAMNPPAPQNLDPKTTASNYYLGSEPLDMALTDRFGFIVEVPLWGDLSKEHRARIIQPDVDATSALPGFLGNYIAKCRAKLPQVEAQCRDWLNEYVDTLFQVLEREGLPQSPRRAHTLAQVIVAVHAARLILEGDDADIEESVEMALLNCLPQIVSEVPPSFIKLIAIHRQVWEIIQYLENDHWRLIYQEPDLARRVVMADHLGFDDYEMSRLITQAISGEPSNIRQIGLATAMLLAFKDRRDLPAVAFEPLVQLAYHVLEPRTCNTTIYPNSPESRVYDEIRAWMEETWQDSALFRLKRNFVLQGFPAQWRQQSWQSALEQFVSDLMMFNAVDGEAA
jgi:MoxR-like ATPase